MSLLVALLSQFKEKLHRGITFMRKLSIFSPVVALLMWPQGVFAGGFSIIGGLFSSLIGGGVDAAVTLLGWVLIIWGLSSLLASTLSKFFIFLVNFLIGISQYNSFLGSQIVQIGWPVARDLANLFLVVALLVIAFATILNIQSYQATTLLKDFLITALFVNFSRMICGVIIDAAQVVMMTFVSGFSDTAAGNFVSLFQTDKWFKLAIDQAASAVQKAGDNSGAIGKITGDVTKFASNQLSGVAGNVFVAFVALLACIAVASLLIILIQRIVVLWFLVLASPLAFVARVLPATKSFYSKWWSEFSKQLIVGPVVAFIIWISLASAAATAKPFDVLQDSVQQGNNFAETQNAGAIGSADQAAISMSAISQWENLAMFMLPVFIFILGAKWAVGLAGGLGASVAGKVSSFGTGLFKKGMNAWVRQGITSGKYSAWSQAKAGFSGKGGVGSRAIGFTLEKGIGGGLQKYGQVIGSTKVANVGSWIRTGSRYIPGVGAVARAEGRKTIKTIKGAASHLGLGELGEKRTTAKDQAELAERYAKEGRGKFDEAMQKVQTLRQQGQHEEADALEKEAVARFKASEGKAAEERKKGVDAQKDIFKAEGKTDPKLLADEIKKKQENGTLTEVEVAAADDMMKESFEKEMTKEVNDKRAEYAQQGRVFDADAERKVKADVDIRQAPIKAEMKQATDAHRAATGAAAATQARKDAETRMTQAARDASPEYGTDEAVRRFQPGGLADGDIDQLAQAIGRAVGKSLERHDSTQKQDEFVMQGAKQLSVDQQAGFFNFMRGDPNQQVVAAVNRVAAATTAMRAQTIGVRRAIEAKNATSDELGRENGWSIKDMGGEKGLDGKVALPPEQALKIQALVNEEPTVVVNMRADALGNADLKRIIGQSLDPAKLATLNAALQSEKDDQKEILAHLKLINNAVQAHSSDNVVKQQAAELVRAQQRRGGGGGGGNAGGGGGGGPAGGGGPQIVGPNGQPLRP